MGVLRRLEPALSADDRQSVARMGRDTVRGGLGASRMRQEDHIASVARSVRASGLMAVCVFAGLCALPLLITAPQIIAILAVPSRSTLISMVLLLLPLVGASFAFASKVCFDSCAPHCPWCSGKLDHLGVTPHTNGMLDLGPSPRLYSCPDCDRRISIPAGLTSLSKARVCTWVQPRYGQLRVGKIEGRSSTIDRQAA
jgi:hypothetical protein